MVRVTNLTPPGSDNPSRAYGHTHTPKVVGVSDTREWSGVEWSGVEWSGVECAPTAPVVVCIALTGARRDSRPLGALFIYLLDLRRN
jgi:hypothetical protein